MQGISTARMARKWEEAIFLFGQSTKILSHGREQLEFAGCRPGRRVRGYRAWDKEESPEKKATRSCSAKSEIEEVAMSTDELPDDPETKTEEFWADHEIGWQARLDGEPCNRDATEGWKHGWRAAGEEPHK